MKNRRPHKKTTVGKRGATIDGDVSGSAIITGDGNVVQISAPADPVATALHQVPPPPADFTGRKDELEELLAAIEQGGVTISGLQGLGGIGKTALALKLVEQLKSRYPDAQFYLDLKGASNQPLTVSEALAHVVRAYYPAAKLPDSESELRGLYLSVLDGQRAILLMDNAKSAEQVEPLIPPAGCVLLVTSRWLFTLPGLAAKNLDTLTAADAGALLLAIAPRMGEWTDEIARLCSYLPLALRLAAGSLAKYVNLKPADYARRLQDTQQRLQLIEASLTLSYELLTEELRERWRWLAVFPDSFDDTAAAAVWEVEVDETRNTLGELIAASMVEWDETTVRYRLHDLARLFTDAKLSDEERTAGLKRHAMHYRDVLIVANDLYLRGGEAMTRGLALFDLEWGNIQAGYNWVAVRDVEVSHDIDKLAMGYPIVGVYLLDLRQHPREWIPWMEIALTAAKRLKDQVNESIALGNLGSAHYRLGESQQAIQFYEQQLTIVRELGYHIGEGNALVGLGNAYGAVGKTQRAIRFYEQALLIHRELADRRGESNVLTNLGVEYSALGEIQRSMQLYEEALLIDRELGDRRGESIGLWNMSLALYRLGKRTQAIQYAEQSLTIREQIEDPFAAKVRAQLAAWREESG